LNYNAEGTNTVRLEMYTDL